MTKLNIKPQQQDALSLLTEHEQQRANAMLALLRELNADETLQVAAIGFVAADSIDENELAKTLPHNAIKIIYGAKQFSDIEAIETVDDPSKQDHHADKLRKMLIAMVDDARVVMLKLIEQLINLKTLKDAPRSLQIKAADQVQRLYAPLANRLGIGQIKWQLEDWAFRYHHPDRYQDMKKALNMRRTDREAFVAQMMQRLSDLMKQSGIKDFDISGRAKHIYSIYKKIERKKVGFEEIYDAIALRILVRSIEECYTVLSFINASWPHIPQEFDDYISNPKPNGYRSIHTAVIGPNNRSVEIQIRTFTMHEEAEMGVCAHWAYKEGASNKGEGSESKIAWLRQVMAWQQEVSHPNDTDIDHSLFDDRVYVFTPQGDIIDLVKGATPLDFAYHIHSDIGHRCRGANVNGKLVPLTYQLKTGDRISIQTGKESKPSRDWLHPDNGYIATPRARSKIGHFFRQQSFKEHCDAGQQLWDKTWRHKHLDKNVLNTCYQHFNYKNLDSLLAAIGSGDITIHAILQHLSARDKKTPTEQEFIATKASNKTQQEHQSAINIAGVDNLLTNLAKCCKPIPGDEIIGYITQGRGISIHQKHCHALKISRAKNPERVIQVSWGVNSTQFYPVDIHIATEDRQGLLRDITQILHQEKINVLRAHTHSKRIDNTAILDMTIEISALESLEKIINKLMNVAGVISITR